MVFSSFKRVEQKYIVNETQKQGLLKVIYEHMVLDSYCKNEQPYKIQNIYYDTLNNDLISNSISKPPFKQKLRARKYDGQDFCYLEIKKKSDGVVGKRRLALTYKELDDFISRRIIPQKEKFIDKAVIGEIDYLLNLYEVFPKVFISYERLGFFDQKNKELRITFDKNIHTKRHNLAFDTEDYERDLLPKGTYILEIKSICNLPLWLTHELTKLRIFPKSFSKYGQEYKYYLQGV